MGLQKANAAGDFEDWRPRDSVTARVSKPVASSSKSTTDLSSTTLKRTNSTISSSEEPVPKKTRLNPTSNEEDWFQDHRNGYNSAPSVAASSAPSRKNKTSTPLNEDWFSKSTDGYDGVAASQSSSTTAKSNKAKSSSTTRKRTSSQAATNEDGWFADSSNGYAGTDTSQAASSSSKKKGKAKQSTPKTPKPPKEKPEKRAARFRSSCPQNILDRADRAAEQRFFLVDRRRDQGQLKEEFDVTGSTGNIYTITIDHTPSCSCPDSQKGNHCKHILFIFLKVLQVTHASGFWYQKALLTSELETIFSEAPAAPNDVSNPRIKDAYARAQGKTIAEDSSKKRRLPTEDDDCPICYDKMHKDGEGKLTFCDDCGNALHTVCFGEWKMTSAKSGKLLTCVFCRANWVIPGARANAASSSRSREGYLNIGSAVGLSPVRDTSTYYQGPRRGQRHYGYIDYD